ncbi:MAG: serine hydrolase domain-containing protein [Microscillaceae bacterium]|nr:serine hydrolase domain-containing protein [Microscillaceae bacterium]
MKYLISTLFWVITLASCKEQPVNSIDKIVKFALKKHKIVGASIAIVDSTGIIYSKGYGYADKANTKLVTSETVFPFGSVSKAITMASVLKLQELGKLNIDSAFTKYVPDFQIKQHFKEVKSFTVFDLLTQQAGIPRTRLKNLYTDFAKPTDFYQLIHEEKENYLIAPPKKVYQYSDIGFSMLGLLPKYTIQRDYHDFVMDEIFKPLDMNSASFNINLAGENYTKGYENGREVKVYAMRNLPTGGLQANVMDIAKFTAIFLNSGKSISGKQFLPSEIVEKSIQRQNQETKIAFSNHLGLAWWIDDFYGYKSVYHGGLNKPCASIIKFLPELKIGLVLVINSDMNREFITEVTEKVLLALMDAKSIKYQKNYYEKNEVTKAENSDYFKNLFKGDYASSYGIINVTPLKKHYEVNLISANKKLRGTLMSDSTLQLEYMVLGVYPVKVMRLFVNQVDSRKIIGTKSAKSGRKIFGGEKIEFEKPNTKWDDISGKYIIYNLDGKEYSLLNEILVSEYKGLKVISGEKTLIPDVEKFQFCIRPVNDNLAIVQGIGGQGLLGETIKRFDKNSEEFIEIAGYVFKKQK